MRIDSHQHFWRFNPADYGWMKPDWPIRRDFLPADLEPELRACNLDGCVAVQARQSLAESRWLLELAEGASIIRGVVGWVDLRSPNVAKELEEFAAHPKFVGVRHVVQDEPDDQFMLREDFQRGIAALRRLRFDLRPADFSPAIARRDCAGAKISRTAVRARSSGQAADQRRRAVAVARTDPGTGASSPMSLARYPAW